MAKSGGGVGNLAKIALNAGRSASTASGEREIVDIITFIESEWGLKLKLYPVQRVILKAHYGIALDNNPVNRFPIVNWRDEPQGQFTEAEYLAWIYDQGRSNIREVVSGQERRNMVLSVGRRAGKCVTGDTLLLTDKGIVRMDSFDGIQSWVDYPGAEHFPLDMGVAQEGKRRARSAYFYRGGRREIVRIRTSCGYELGGTPNHRIRVMLKKGCIAWKQLSEFVEGEVVAIHRNTDLWAQEYVRTQEVLNGLQTMRKLPVPFPEVVRENWGLLLGLLTGGGHRTVKDGVQLTLKQEDLRELVGTLCRSLLGEQVSYEVDGDVCRVAGNWYREFLHALGWDWSWGREDQHVPWVIFQSPRAVVCAFLRGLFEINGEVEKDGGAVTLTVVSEQLAREVQLLLLNLGVVARRRAKWNGERQHYEYILTVQGMQTRQRFAEAVGFMSQGRMERLCEGLHDVQREWGMAERIPHQRQWCQRLVDTLSNSDSTGAEKPWTLLSDVWRNTSTEDMTYSHLATVIQAAKLVGTDPEVIEHFQEIQEADYFFDPVVTVWKDVEVVYDLNVPEGSSFVANGMTNHNTSLSACIAAYETYKLLNKGFPQKHYGLTLNSTIQLISVATGKDQAGLLYQEASGHFARCSFFKRYIANNTMSYARFQTPTDIEVFGPYQDNPKARASIRVTFAACNAKGLRGPGNILIILDEVAHFVEQGGSSAEQVYEAVSPSAATFTPKDELGRPIHGRQTRSDGRIILISSPLGKQGLFYKMFEMGKSGGDAAENMLCIQAPTWEVNPTIPTSVFKEKYAQDPNVFFTEFGGEFTDRTLGWLDNPADLMACIDPNLKPRSRGDARRPYFVGFDLGLVVDASAIAIVHLDEQQRIVLDFISQIKAGEGEYADKERLEFDDVADWIYNLSRKFYFQKGIFDMWNAIPLEQALTKKGLQQLKGEHFTAPLNSLVYQNFKAMIWDKKVVFYDYTEMERQQLTARGKDVSEHMPYLEELLSLQADFKSKYVINVQAPQTAGKHDDMSDALARAVWLASQSISTTKHFARNKTEDPNQRKVSGKVRRHNHLMRLRGGSDPKRQIPRSTRRI